MRGKVFVISEWLYAYDRFAKAFEREIVGELLIDK